MKIIKENLRTSCNWRAKWAIGESYSNFLTTYYKGATVFTQRKRHIFAVPRHDLQLQLTPRKQIIFHLGLFCKFIYNDEYVIKHFQILQNNKIDENTFSKTSLTVFISYFPYKFN